LPKPDDVVSNVPFTVFRTSTSANSVPFIAVFLIALVLTLLAMIARCCQPTFVYGLSGYAVYVAMPRGEAGQHHPLDDDRPSFCTRDPRPPATMRIPYFAACAACVCSCRAACCPYSITAASASTRSVKRRLACTVASTATRPQPAPRARYLRLKTGPARRCHCVLLRWQLGRRLGDD
jgi:hypothetical protein